MSFWGVISYYAGKAENGTLQLNNLGLDIPSLNL